MFFEIFIIPLIVFLTNVTGTNILLVSCPQAVFSLPIGILFSSSIFNISSRFSKSFAFSGCCFIKLSLNFWKYNDLEIAFVIIFFMFSYSWESAARNAERTDFSSFLFISFSTSK